MHINTNYGHILLMLSILSAHAKGRAIRSMGEESEQFPKGDPLTSHNREGTCQGTMHMKKGERP